MAQALPGRNFLIRKDGVHRITSRAVDTSGHTQPAPDEWPIAKKHTYWEANGQITRRIRI